MGGRASRAVIRRRRHGARSRWAGEEMAQEKKKQRGGCRSNSGDGGETRRKLYWQSFYEQFPALAVLLRLPST